MSVSREILADIEEQLVSKKIQRDALIGQLTLLDVIIDKYDDLISKIDTDAISIANIINQAILPVKEAYDARIAANCRSDLSWVLNKTWQSRFYYNSAATLVTFYEYEVKKNPNTYAFVPYRGLKYYRKPLNRDYGANIVYSFYGSVSVGSTVISIINGSDIPSPIQLGDKIVDNIDNPILFSPANIPSITGFGFTSGVGIVTTLVGGISTGSTIFAHYGAGISSVGISTGMSFNYVGIVTSTIVGFSTTTFNITYLNENGVYVTDTEVCDGLILNSPASQGINEGIFTVGIATQFPAIFISTSSLGFNTNAYLNVLRIGDVDIEFDYTQSPLEPLTIGVVNSSTLGVGHSISLDASGDPSNTEIWSPSFSYFDDTTKTVINPQPLVGAGRADYYVGTYKWPLLTTCIGFTEFFCSSSYVSEGFSVVTSSPSDLDYAYTSNAGVNTNGSLCQQLTQNIDNAINNMNLVLSQNSSSLQPLIDATKALRGNRDGKELQAWSMLQAVGSITEDIQRLERDIRSMRTLDFSPYETT